MAGEEENLLGAAEIHEEAEGLALALFVKADENIIKHDGERLNLFAKGKRHREANGQEYLVAGAGGPDFCLLHMVLPIDDADVFPVIGNREGVFPFRHGLQEFIGPFDDLRLPAGFISGLGFFQDFPGIHIGEPFGESIFQLPFDTLFFLQSLGDGVIIGQAENLISYRPLLLLQILQTCRFLFDFLSKRLVALHPLVVFAAFEDLPKRLKSRIAAGVETKVLLHILPILHQLVMLLVGIHLCRKFLGILRIDKAEEGIHFPLARRPAVIELLHLLLVLFVLVVLFLDGLPGQASLLGFLVELLDAIGADAIVHVGHGNNGIGPAAVHIQLAIHLLQAKVQDFPLPFGGVDFLPLLLQRREVIRRGLGQCISFEPIAPIFVGLLLLFFQKLAFFHPFPVLLLLLADRFFLPRSRLPFGLILVEIGALFLHQVLESLQTFYAGRRLSIEGVSQLFALPFQKSEGLSPFLQILFLLMNALVVQQERKDSKDHSTAGAIECRIACHGHVEGAHAGRCAGKEHHADPKPQGIALVFFAMERRDFLLHVRFLMQQIFQRIGFGLQSFPFLFGKDSLAFCLFFQRLYLRLPLLPEMKFIGAHTQTLRQAPPFGPVHIDARGIQAKRPIPQRKGVAQLDEIQAPVFSLLFQERSVRDSLPPLTQVYIELFQRLRSAGPGNDFFLFLRRVLVQLFLKRFLLLMNHLHAVHELVPLLFPIGWEHFHL